MSKEREQLPSLKGDVGNVVRFYVDESKPSNDIFSRRIETVTDGTSDKPLEVPLHWHKHHDEYWTMLEGRMLITLDGKEFVLEAGDEPLYIPRRHIHGLKALKGEKAAVTESTNPPGPFKEAYIRDLIHSTGSAGFGQFWGAMRVNFDGDTYLSLGGPQILDELFLNVVGGIAKLIAPANSSNVKTSAA